MDVNLQQELIKLKAYKQIIRKKRYYKSKLDPVHGEIMQRRLAGYNISDIHLWLTQEKKIKVHWSTVKRFIDKQHG